VVEGRMAAGLSLQQKMLDNRIYYELGGSIRQDVHAAFGPWFSPGGDGHGTAFLISQDLGGQADFALYAKLIRTSHSVLSFSLYGNVGASHALKPIEFGINGPSVHSIGESPDPLKPVWNLGAGFKLSVF